MLGSDECISLLIIKLLINLLMLECIQASTTCSFIGLIINADRIGTCEVILFRFRSASVWADRLYREHIPHFLFCPSIVFQLLYDFKIILVMLNLLLFHFLCIILIDKLRFFCHIKHGFIFSRWCSEKGYILNVQWNICIIEWTFAESGWRRFLTATAFTGRTFHLNMHWHHWTWCNLTLGNFNSLSIFIISKCSQMCTL